MTAEQLLKPRFEVIADYPDCKFKIGDILNQDGVLYDHKEPQTIELNPALYPHLFQKLNWWEHRKAEEMPKRLICKAIEGDTEILEIEEWDMEILFGWTNIEKREGCGLLSFKPKYGYFPVD
jgi:hypothetical protein